MSKNTGKTKDDLTVFVSGNFNVLHNGHVRLLKFARELGGRLIVGVNPDDSSGVYVPLDHRIEGVASSRFVTEVMAVEGDLSDLLKVLKPDIIVKGSEHKASENVEKEILDSYGGRLIFASGDSFSAAFSAADGNGARWSIDALPHKFMHRHDIDIGKLKQIIAKLAPLNVLVIGDLIVDDYVDCAPLGMSQEDPTIVVTPQDERRYIGGAGIVAAHVKGLGANVTFMSVVGDDEAAEFAERELAGHGVTTRMMRDDTRPTTRKRRYRAAGKTLLRVSHLRQHAASSELSKAMLQEVDSLLPSLDLILFADFNYGCLSNEFVDAVTALARSVNIPMTADSQASSQLSDITRFKGMLMIAPTELEARLALKDNSSNLVVLGDHLLKAAHAPHAIVTLGAEGIIIINEDDGFKTDRIGALNSNPVDVAGAGDSLFAASSLVLAAGLPIWEAALLGSIVAAHQVGRTGNTPISKDEILGTLEAAQI